jgi:hypothetical protein
MSNEAEVVGVFLGDESIYGGQVDEMRNLFGRRLVVAEDAEALMVVLGTFLARLFHQSAI